jgi:purine-binding chemotaxis protein CheW
MAKPAAAAAPQGPRRFLTFRLDARRYALPAEEVAEVIRTPAVARLPQSPRGLLGLANLRGSVLPVASLRGLLGLADEASGRALVLNGHAPVALAVDQVDALVSVDPERIEVRRAELAAEPGERLAGAFQPEGSDTVVKVLDVRALLEQAFRARERKPRTAQTRAEPGAGRAEAPRREQVRLVTFEVAGQEYGLELDAVREIVPAPATVTTSPRADASVVGIAAYRDGLLPLLSLRSLLGFAPDPTGQAGAKVLVTTVGGALAGLVADRTRSILSVDQALVEPAPAMLAARAGGESRIAAIYRGDGGRRLVSILAPDKLLREDVMQRLAQNGSATASTPQDAAESGRRLQILVFRLGDEELGLPIEAVDEVARAPEKITRVPNAPAFLEGVVNLRGEVLPVVDQRKRFGLPPLEGDDRRRLVVVRTERHRAGILVDAVSEVLRSAWDEVEPAPDLTGEATRLVQGVVNLEHAGRMVLLLDPAELLTRAEHGLLDAFEAEAGQAGS